MYVPFEVRKWNINLVSVRFERWQQTIIKMKKVIYETQWVVKDSSKEYPHGWGFTAPLVEFPQDADPVWCAEICRKELSNDEFECINAIPKPVLTNIHYPKM